MFYPSSHPTVPSSRSRPTIDRIRDSRISHAWPRQSIKWILIVAQFTRPERRMECRRRHGDAAQCQGCTIERRCLPALHQIPILIRPPQSNISFSQHLEDNLQTLSTHNSDQDGRIDGFLYVPDLLKNDECYNISKQYIPANVTRQANLPPTVCTLLRPEALRQGFNVSRTVCSMTIFKKTDS
jgi:hypothetical protein